MTVGVISHHSCGLHNMGEFHPESPARLSAIQDQLISSGLDFAIRQFDAKPIAPELLSLAHDQAYIDYVFEHAPESGEFRLDPDTTMNPYTLPAALLSAGAVIQAVDLVMSKEITAMFCATRPPGHHAEKDKAMGFCFFNNIAIGATYALKQYPLKKIAILDFDVHHGNGTENIVAGNPNILFCSTFQHPFYPFSGTSKAPNNIINTPLPAGAASKEFQEAVKTHWLPALEDFKPELLMISAGFDAHAEDDMSQVNLVDSDYLWVTNELKLIADRFCDGRIVSTLEGGYALSALGRSVVAHINGLLGN